MTIAACEDSATVAMGRELVMIELANAKAKENRLHEVIICL